MTTSKPRSAIGYARISDARGGVRSLEDQQHDMRAAAERLGWTITTMLVEPDTSAWKRRKIDGVLRVVRPVFHQALELLTSGRADGFLAYDLDRACRDPRDLEDLIDAVEQIKPRPAVESVTGSLRLANDADVTQARIMVAVANKASRDTSRRVGRAARTRAEAGGSHGGRRPFGYEADGVALREDEAAELRAVVDALLAGTSLRAVTGSLNTRGIRTVTGVPWTTIALRDVLLRPRNAGLSVHRGEVVGRGCWEPILDEATWLRVCALLNDPARRTTPGSQVRWLGSGLYRCGICGAPMRCTRAGGSKKPSYTCMEQKHLMRNAERLDEFVVGALLVRLADPRLTAARRPAPTGPDPDELARQVTALQEREARIGRALEDPDEDFDTMRTALRKVREALVLAQADLLAATTRTAVADPVRDLADADDLPAAWLALDLDRRRAILADLVEVTVLPSSLPSGSRAFDESAVRLDWK